MDSWIKASQEYNSFGKIIKLLSWSSESDSYTSETSSS